MDNNITLQVINNGKEIFRSDKRWLYPLFDLETYLNEHPLDISNAEIHDKIIGKAAALLILRLGINKAHAGVISKLACAVFDQIAFPYTYTTLVDRISCKTEELLLDIDDPDIAYRILLKRAGLDK